MNNLALLSPERRAAIERDKQRWFRAWKMYRTWDHRELRLWLDVIDEEPVREDWRRRLNAIRRRALGKA